jgi:hypothetical protein
VLAGSSPQACAECGAPWERVTIEKGDLVPVRGNLLPGRYSDKDRGPHAMPSTTAIRRWSAPTRVWSLLKRETRTTGWQPTCDHSDGSARCTVLDPFSGAGTTGVVALRHDRDYIGIELNPTYAQMARDRIYDDGPLLNLILGDAA